MNALLTVDGFDNFVTGLLSQVRDYMTRTEQEIIGNASPLLSSSCDKTTAEKLDASEAFQAMLQEIAREKGFTVTLQWLSHGIHQQPYLSFRETM
jgi:hypothetical protein